MRFMPDFSAWQGATHSERMRLATVFVRDNPHVVAAYFHLRFNLFRKLVINPKFHVKDHWYRYEWQGRGSTHSHGLYYCEDVPDPDVELGSSLTPFRLARFAQYWGCHVSGIHPEPVPDVLVEERSTLSLPFIEMEFNLHDLSSILTRCYLHRCFAAYCLRKDKTTGLEVCRFEAPWPLLNDPTFNKAPGKSYYRFQPRRNHPRLNAYSNILALGWRANTDIQVCTSTTGVVQYMGVYASKGEVQTESYRDLAQQVLPNINSNNPMFSFASRLMNKLVGERNYSAQEVTHTLFGYPLVNSSRTTINVDCRPEEEQGTSYNFNRRSVDILDDEPVFQQVSTVLAKYRRRPASLELVCYIDYLLHYSHVPGQERRRKRAQPRILNFIPRYNPHANPSDFARVKVMLHHPFRSIQDAIRIGERQCDNWEEALAVCRAACTHDIIDSYGDPELGLDEEDTNLERIDRGSEDPVDELGMRHPALAGELVDEDNLGRRPTDFVKDWSDTEHIAPADLDPMSYWRNAKRDFPVVAVTTSITPSITFFGKQQVFFDLITNHFTSVLEGNNPGQLLVNLDGEGGTGKTFVIESVSRAVDALAAQHGLPSPILRCAPTGVAAYLISGRTLNSVFRIPITVKYGALEPLSATGRQQLQSVFRHLRYLIIDEKSMVSLQMLGWIHSRCIEAVPDQSELPFSGLNVVLSGDFCQLPPVARRPLFDCCRGSTIELEGRRQYLNFIKTIQLDVVVRQEGTAQAGFRNALGRLRVGASTQNDWALLMSRCRAALPENIRNSFISAPRLCPTRSMVATINHDALRDFSAPVIAISALHDNTAWSKIDSKDAGNLHNKLYLCIGARIMLLHNIWTERGLVNGASGVVENIVWVRDTINHRDTFPCAVLVSIDGYSGPGLYTLPSGRVVVPIFPERREFYIDRELCSRTQFPITLSWAITIHKSQGLSLEKAVIRVAGQRDFVPGLLYVAVSRVRSLEGLVFDEPITFDRLRGVSSDFVKQRDADYARRAGQQVRAEDTLFS